MLDFKIKTPIGVKDILPEEMRAKKAVCKNIEKIFESYGYSQVESPIFEYSEVFSDKKIENINFLDKESRQVSLRSDMTPSIARIVATEYEKIQIPLKLCYFGNVINYESEKYEHSEAGIELIGAYGVDADAEVIAISIKSILSSGINNFKINISNVKFLNAIFEEAGFEKNIIEELKCLIANKNYSEIEKKVGNSQKLFLELPKLIGGKEIIEYTKKITNNKYILNILDEMEKLYSILVMYGVEKYVNFDFSMVNERSYYTGIIFKGYVCECQVVSGGRYDNLLSEFGKKTYAAGFGVKIDELVNIAINENPKIAEKKVNAMIAFDNNGRSAAMEIANIYRKGGVNIETSFIVGNFDKNIEYMKEKGYESILYFKDNKNIKYARNTEEYGIIMAEINKKDLTLPENIKE